MKTLILCNPTCRNPSLGLATKVRACKVAGPKEAQEWRKVWGNEPSHSQGAPTLGIWSPDGLLNLRRTIAWVKTQWIEKFLISLESYWNVNVWNEFAWPIWTLKTQVMPKRKVGSQVWLLAIKSWKSIQFPYVQVACHTPLESSRWELQLWFILHFNQKSVHKVMGPQNCRSPNFGNFRTPIWES